MLYKTVRKTDSEIEIVGLGICHAVRMKLDGGVGYKWRIKWRNITVMGDYHADNHSALLNANQQISKTIKHLEMIAIAIFLALICESYNSLTK